MKKIALWIVIGAFFTFFSMDAQAQGMKGRWGLGVGAGVQKLFGDGVVNTDKFGFGVDGTLSRYFSERLSLSLTAGFNQLPYTAPAGAVKVNFVTEMLFGDLKLDFDLLKGSFRPYVSAGGGLYTFKLTSGNSKSNSFKDAAFIGGGGFRLALGKKARIDIGASYKHTTGDGLDGVKAGGNDGFLTVRGGLALLLGEPSAPEPVAMEEAPLVTIDTEAGDDLRSRLDSLEGAKQPASGQDMEQYVKMKSKMDDLNQQIDTKETEIASLRQSIDQKKQSIGELESQPNVRPVTINTAQGFARAYEEALNKFYAKRYQESIQDFTQLLAQYPNHSLASNCQYWIGEAHFGSGDNAKAVEAFNLVLTYQRSLKQDDALLMLAKSYIKLGQPANARQSLDRLLREFPNSEFVSKAEELRGKI